LKGANFKTLQNVLKYSTALVFIEGRKNVDYRTDRFKLFIFCWHWLSLWYDPFVADVRLRSESDLKWCVAAKRRYVPEADSASQQAA